LVKYMAHKNGVENKGGGTWQKCKQKAFVTLMAIMNFFKYVKPYKKCNPTQMRFIEDLVLMIAKGCMPFSIVESLSLKWMVLCNCGQV
jgi:hypothetical protein